MNQTRQQAERARKAFLKLSTSVDRTAILKDVASALRENAHAIFEANTKDLANAKAAGTSTAGSCIITPPRRRKKR